MLHVAMSLITPYCSVTHNLPVNYFLCVEIKILNEECSGLSGSDFYNRCKHKKPFFFSLYVM